MTNNGLECDLTAIWLRWLRSVRRSKCDGHPTAGGDSVEQRQIPPDLHRLTDLHWTLQVRTLVGLVTNVWSWSMRTNSTFRQAWLHRNIEKHRKTMVFDFRWTYRKMDSGQFR